MVSPGILTRRYFSSISEIEHDYGLMARPAVRVGNGRADRGGACRDGWRERGDGLLISRAARGKIDASKFATSSKGPVGRDDQLLIV